MPSPKSDSSPPISPSEREVLAMLAEGHTAKSIATELNLSVNAVNERLREARRKTGAASSRELARHLAAQENWDKETGVSSDALPDADPETPGAAIMARQQPRSLIIMFITVAAIALAVVGVQNASTSTQEISEPVGSEASVSRGVSALDPFQARFDAETRDSDWAAPAELRALAFFTLVNGVRSVQVHCAATLCRVEGRVVPDAMKGAKGEVRGDTLRDRLRGAGLEMTAAGFRDAPNKVEGGKFTAFLRRAV
ncbi:helix-turn-helix domain-containing protein [Sphingopyxis sp. FD7]|uniref:helix-turn-helix domain-containing protein n=1 Tax=Sphingopyxis sp. FD7 TaxID=1914525 RepID=UPI000DC63FE4|nr:helix-turn-helix transcriptional regulator [Sphingopyxis sp. FD7]BBB14459.1 transcriptional regulator LuxR family [Sphingopyxis sp. FD7]